MSNQRRITILTEHDGGELRPISWEGLALARANRATNARILTSTKVGCYGYTSIQSTLLTQLCTR